MTQPQIQTVKRYPAFDIWRSVRDGVRLIEGNSEWIPASDYDALDQRVDLIASQANRLNDEKNALRESLREAQTMTPGGWVDHWRKRADEYALASRAERTRAEKAEASLREQEELLQWAQGELVVLVPSMQPSDDGYTAQIGKTIARAKAPTILAALRALRERVAPTPPPS